MTLEDYIVKIKELKVEKVEGKGKIIIECEDETEYYCPYCGSYRLRTKDSFERNIRHIEIGGRESILRYKVHKYRCEDCGKYFIGHPQGILKYQQSSEYLKKDVFKKHCEGVSKKDLSRDYGVSDSSIERWFQYGYKRG